MLQTKFAKTFGAKLPIIMAPMFLVSDTKMIKAAAKSGIVGTFPTLNYRDNAKLDSVLKEINKYIKKKMVKL